MARDINLITSQDIIEASNEEFISKYQGEVIRFVELISNFGVETVNAGTALYRYVVTGQLDDGVVAPGTMVYNKTKDALPAYAQIPHFTLTTAGRDIQVTGVRIGSAYEVFDMQGHVITKGRTNAASFNLTMSHAGLYLVRIGSQAQKVQVK